MNVSLKYNKNEIVFQLGNMEKLARFLGATASVVKEYISLTYER